jgi:two-component system, chemotaxis family, chemotaxis protein CheY
MTKILIADDASFMRLMIRQTLSNRGQTEIFEAENGQVALEIFKEHRPDLIFLDITMPVLDGVSTLSEILTIDPKAKVIMCSAIAQESVIREALSIGAVDFIIKPFRSHQILEAVRKHLTQ